MFKDNVWGEFVGIMTAENMDDEIEIKLNDDEKLKLIEFYMEDETLWNNDHPNRNIQIKKTWWRWKFINHSMVGLEFWLKKPSTY